jgi:hypothetical protein
MARATVDKWLNEGWSPLRIGYALVSAILTASGAATYVKERNHPGAIWYLVGALAVVVVYLTAEVMRWRTKHRRLEAKQKAMQSVAKLASKHHRRDLQVTAKKFAEAIRRDGDAEFGTRAEKLALRGHFPDVYDQLSQWMAQATLRDVYPRFLKLYIDNDLRHQKVA